MTRQGAQDNLQQNEPGAESAPAEAVREQLARIVRSSVFSDSQRMIRFLRFAVEETLNGNASRLKEIVIGTEVFDRHPAYDPRLDPIVRVEARRLRAKLRAYYDGSGELDPVVIEFPKGRYSPVFQLRSESRPSTAVSAAAPDDSTIAVLPFINLDPEKDSDYFSDGLSEELIHALTRIHGLMVVAWNSASQLRERQEDIGAIRRHLDVAYVLRGSVRRTGQRLRITAQLIETATGHYAWSESYDRQMRDVFAIQQEIATAIAGALKLRFSPDEGDRPDPGGQRNLDVYQLCLKGRFHARERTAIGLKRSVICFEQAISIDNASAAAYAGLADALTLIADYGYSDGCDSMAKARKAALKALELDPVSAEAHASLGLILTQYDWAWTEAAEAFERALALNPAYEPAHHWYAIDHLAMLGRFEEAEEHLEIAIKLDPLSPILLEGRAFLKTLQRKYDDAIESYLRLLQMDPSLYKVYTSMGRAYLQKDMYAKAIELLEKGRSLIGDLPSVLGALGQAHGLLGNVSEARALLRKLAEIADARPVNCTCFALIHLGLGEKEDALTWLERGVRRHQSPVVALKVHPAWDRLRDEPRFEALLEMMGLGRESYGKTKP